MQRGALVFQLPVLGAGRGVELGREVVGVVGVLGLGKAAPTPGASKPVPAPAAAPERPLVNGLPVTSPNVEGRDIPAPSGSGMDTLLAGR